MLIYVLYTYFITYIQQQMTNTNDILLKATSNKIELLTKDQSKDWFTIWVIGEPKRYIVWLTNNDGNVKMDTLASQAIEYSEIFKNITVWWRTDKDTNEFYFDIGTSTDNIKNAMALWLWFSQLAIRDNQEMVEIRTGFVR